MKKIVIFALVIFFSFASLINFSLALSGNSPANNSLSCIEDPETGNVKAVSFDFSITTRVWGNKRVYSTDAYTVIFKINGQSYTATFNSDEVKQKFFDDHDDANNFSGQISINLERDVFVQGRLKDSSGNSVSNPQEIYSLLNTTGGNVNVFPTIGFYDIKDGVRKQLYIGTNKGQVLAEADRLGFSLKSRQDMATRWPPDGGINVGPGSQVTNGNINIYYELYENGAMINKYIEKTVKCGLGYTVHYPYLVIGSKTYLADGHNSSSYIAGNTDVTYKFKLIPPPVITSGTSPVGDIDISLDVMFNTASYIKTKSGYGIPVEGVVDDYRYIPAPDNPSEDECKSSPGLKRWLYATNFAVGNGSNATLDSGFGFKYDPTGSRIYRDNLNLENSGLYNYARFYLPRVSTYPKAKLNIYTFPDQADGVYSVTIKANILSTWREHYKFWEQKSFSPKKFKLVCNKYHKHSQSTCSWEYTCGYYEGQKICGSSTSTLECGEDSHPHLSTCLPTCTSSHHTSSCYHSHDYSHYHHHSSSCSWKYTCTIPEHEHDLPSETSNCHTEEKYWDWTYGYEERQKWYNDVEGTGTVEIQGSMFDDDSTIITR